MLASYTQQIFNSFHNQVEFGMILEGLRNFGVGLNLPPLGMPLSTPQLVGSGDWL